MRNLNFFRRSERKSVGTTLALTVGSPSAHRRHSALKHLAFMLLFLLGSLNVWGEDPVTIYAENFGDNGGSNTTVASATCYSASTTMFTTGHQTSVASNYSSDGKVGKNSVSPSDNSGASGNSAVWYQAGTGTNTKTLFQVSNINIANYSSLALKFNLYRTNGASSSNYVTVTYKIDNGTAQTLTYTAPSSNATWTWCSGNLMGTGNSLSITFTMHTTGGFTHRIDDIALTGTASSGSTPSVSLDPDDALNFATVGVGDPAPAAQSFTITGSNMTAALSIADLTNFDYSVTSGSLSPSEGSISATVAVTPKSGFTADAGDKSETLTISGDDLEDDIELALNAEVKAKHDIIFDTDLKSIANVSVTEGETYNITETIEAALIASCTYTKFEGWTTATSIADASVKPSLVSSVTMSTSDVTLKPVFSKTIASGGISGSTIIDYEKLSLGSYADGTNKDDYSWSYTQLMKGTNNTIQGNSSKSSILWNTIEFPAAISKIELVVGNAAGAANTAALSFGSEAKPTSNDIALGNGTSYALNETGTLTIEDGIPANSTYVSLSWTSGASYFTSLKVYYGSDGTTTYSLDPGCAAADQCYAPTFSPAAGTFDVAQNVELACATDGATIRYTIDGSTPSKTVGTVYSSAFAVLANTTIKAIAYKEGLTESSISEGVFNIRYAQPTFSPTGGEYNEAKNVTISAAEADAIYYTTNGEDPTVDPANLYDGSAIAINTTGTHIIKAIAVKAGYANSNVASATYVMDLPYANIAAFIAGAPTTAKSLTLNNAIITGVDGTTLYVQDETAGIMIYGLASLPDNAAPNHSISGTIVGKYSSYKNQHELVKPDNTTPIDISNVTISADEVARPAISEYTSLSAAYEAKPMMLVKLKGVNYASFDSYYNAMFSENKIYNTFNVFSSSTVWPETTVDCDITGIVINYNGTLELLPVFASDIVADADAADPTVNPAGGADAENAVTAAAVEITAAADTKVDGLASKTVDISSITPTEVTVTVTRDFYRSVNYSCGWYKAAAAKYDINGQGATTEGEVVAKVAGVEAATAAEGDDVHVFITPNAHFHLATIKVNGDDPTEVTAGAEYSFEMPDEAVTIAVTWTEDAKYALTFTAGEGSGDAPAISGNEYYAGEVIQLPANTFTYDAQHKFTKWLIGGTEYAAGANYTMPAAPAEAVAQWKEIPNFASGDWILVKDADELSEGSCYVIIASLADDVAMKSFNTTGSDSNCKGKSGADKDGDLLTYDSDYGVFEIVTGNKANTIAFFDVANENYLYAASSGSNHMKAEATLSDNSSWMVSVTGLGAATPTAQGTNTRNEMRYNPNSGSPIFSCYASTATTGSAVAFYKYHVPSLKLSYDKNTTDDVTNLPGMQVADGENKVTVSSEVPLRENYIFNGWKDSESNDHAAGDVITLSANMTLYAQWRTPNTYSISYDANGGTLIDGKSEIDPNPTSVTEGNAYTIEENVYKVDGKLFIGWKANGVTYNAGQVIYPTEDMAFVAQWGDPTVTDFMLVTDVKQLEDGDKVYIVAAGYNVAMGTQHGTDYRNYVEIAKQNNHIVALSVEPIEFTVGKVGDNFTFNDGTGYLYASSSSSNYLNTKADLDDNGKWAITIDANGVASIIAQGTNTRNDLKWNNGTPRFSCYTSGQKAVSIYKRPDYSRDVTEGRFGTICLPKAGKMDGAELFEIAYYGETSEKIFFDNIPSGEMEAGIPYIFLPNAGIEKLGVYYSDNTAAGASSAGSRNGLIGSYDKAVIPAGEGNYILLNNQYCEVVTTAEPVYVGANRAYINLSAISPTEPALAPGRRRISMGVQSQNAATGMDELNASETPVKMLINGQLFILRGEKMYNANGQLVK